jgi:hypothetical protein
MRQFRTHAARVCLALTFLLAGAAQAQEFEFFPGAQYDPTIPTLRAVVGHHHGERITSHAEAERYLKALAAAAPQRVRLEEHGVTWEGRTLYHLILASPANLARLDQVKAGMQKLADPRKTTDGEAESLIRDLPAVTWLAYGVHGNEISSTDAALLAAYHLLAAQDDETARLILDQSIVILDPMQNPDGRDRFVHYFRGTVGRWPDADPQAAEHNETWPSGRSNHYLFDMNRDWFALTQPETRGRIRAYLEWFPVVFVDLHEMGGNSTYYFAPPAQPYNPNLTGPQVEWLNRYGRNNARWFDRLRFDYFTREIFDSFYPGYGEGWPMFHGSIGMTYEQASARGLLFERSDKTTLHYRDSVRHHFVASLSTAETTAKNRQALLRYLYDYRKSAIQEGQREPVKEYILPPGRDPNRAAKLAANLMAQGIEVRRAEAAFTNARVRGYFEDAVQSKEFPAGTFVISLAQPAKRLIKTLLDKHVPAGKDWIDRQEMLRKKRLPQEIYDVTGWSLPLIYDVEIYTAEQPSSGHIPLLTAPPAPAGSVRGGQAHLAYVIAWGANSAAAALADLFRQQVRVHSSDRAFTLGQAKFPAGSLIIKVKDNPADLHARLEKLAAAHGVEVHPTDEAWVEDGVNFGSGWVRYLEPPKVALAWNDPTSSLSAGWTRYLLEQQYGVPVTLLHASRLAGADLSKYNVLILPDSFGAGYTQRVGEAGARRIKDWVQAGGTLIAFSAATRWLTDEKVGLLATHRELRSGKPDKPEKEQKPAEGKPSGDAKPPAEPYDVEKAIQPDRELPDEIPGAILRAQVDGEHWLGFGYPGATNVLVESNTILAPLKLDQGRNVVLFEPNAGQVVLSGLVWEENRKQIAGKAYLLHQPHGRGHVVAFAEDPNYRAFCDGLNLLFLNGVLLGPAH